MATQNGIFVGAMNALYLFDANLSFKSSANLTPPNEVVANCQLFNPGVGECLNYVKVITQVPVSLPYHAGEVLVCGTNAKLPKCNFFNSDDLTKVSPLSNDSTADAGYCPFQPAQTVISLVASNGYYFSGTTFNEVTNQGSIGMARNALNGDKTFVTTSSTIPTWINNGDPAFISTYEMNGCVYFFLTEQAAETSNTEIYSRVVRICTNDTTIDTFGFRTFQKARILCTNAPYQSSLAYSYDELKATVLSNGTLYGAFSSAANGPKGAAICKFPFDGISTAFGTGKYLVLPPSGANWQEQVEPPFSCPGTSRTLGQIANNVLLLNPVQSLGSTPLLQVLGTAFTAIAADSFFSFGRDYDVLYYALEGGGIEQLIITGGASYRSPLTAAASKGYETRELILRKANNMRQLYATTTVGVDMYTLGNCSMYANCFTCLELMDPYCVWNISGEVCVSRLGIGRYSNSLVEAFTLNSTAIFGICGVENYTSTVTSPVHVAPIGPAATCTNATVFGVGQLPASSSVPAGVVAGAAIGGFSVGIPIGVVLCAVALMIKRMFYTDNVFSSRSDGCGEGGVSKNSNIPPACKTGGTPDSVCKHDNVDRDNSAMIDADSGASGGSSSSGHTRSTHSTVDSGYQGYQNVHQNSSQGSAGDDDVIVESGVLSGSHASSTNKLRTESTRWLTASGSIESTDPELPPV